MDMIIEWNEKCDREKANPEEKYTMLQMVGLLMLFYSAGADTTVSNLTGLLYLLG